MTDTHFELMNTLQNQRDQLAELVTLFAHDEYKRERTLAVDQLDDTHYAIQETTTAMEGGKPTPRYLAWFCQFTASRNAMFIERLNSVIIAMPAAAWAESEGAR